MRLSCLPVVALSHIRLFVCLWLKRRPLSPPTILPCTHSPATSLLPYARRSNYVSYRALAMAMFRLFFPHAAVFGGILKWLHIVPSE